MTKYKPIPINRKTKTEIMLAVLELEKRGLECVRPIHKVVNVNYGKVSRTYSSVSWRVYMKKVD